MKDEIKEILDKLKYTAKKHTIQVLENGGMIEHCPQEIETELRLNTYSANILLDHITNLQENYKKSQEENKKDREYIKELRYSLRDCHIKNNKLTIENKRLKELDENYPIEEQLEEALKWKNIYKSRNEKANEYIKENTRWFDSEYAKIYGELVDCAGAKGDRLEVLVNPSNLSKILGGDKDVKEDKD